MTDQPYFDGYYRFFKFYKAMQGATPYFELALTASLTAYLFITRKPKDRPAYAMKTLNLFNTSNSVIIGCMLWQLFDPSFKSDKNWAQTHPQALVAVNLA